MKDHLPVSLSLFPGGRSKALTLSYDDGVIEDRRLVQIFNQHGLRGTFHLNSGTLGREGKLAPEEIATLFRGHEISAHSETHPYLEALPIPAAIQELLEDRRRLEELCGYPVRGMSYPFGTYSQELVDLLPSLGIHYSRTTTKTGAFDLPQSFLLWHPTIHHKQELLETAQRFIDLPAWRRRLRVFYVWGHSYEFRNDQNWQLMEDFAAKIGGRSDIWYATNIEIVDYCEALRQIEFSADFTIALNPTAFELFVSANQKPVRLAPGSQTNLLTGESGPHPFLKG
jgi:peptidoglycan/xylan/chitin deacetylase (PgdA/CDA1 family)